MEQGDRGRTSPVSPRYRAVRTGFAGGALLLSAAVAWILLAGRGGSPPPASAPAAGRTQAAAGAPAAPESRVPPAGSPAATARAVRGRVVHLGGGPAPGASVALFPAGGRRPSYPAPAKDEGVDAALLRDLFFIDGPESAAAVPAALVPSPTEAAPGAPAIGSATSGEDGAFEIPVEGDGPFHLEATLEGAGAAAIDGVPAGGPPLTVVLGSAATLRGVVIDGRSRSPVAGASVLATRGRVVRLATSGGDGTFEITGLSPGPCELLAGAAGYPSVRLRGVDVPTERRPVEVVFAHTRTLLVRVTRRESRARERRSEGERGHDRELRPGRQAPSPVEGATVVAWQGESGTYASAVTGADGQVLLENLRAGSWRVAARAEGLLTGSAASHRPDGSGPEVEEIEIALEPAVPKAVRVVDANGAPVAGAEVFWGGAEGELDLHSRESAGRTGGDGRVSVIFDEGIPRKSAAWVVPPEGATMRVEPSARDEAGELKAVVRSGRSVRGTVRDGGGNPVRGATVTLKVEAGSRELGIGLRTSTDAKGAYAFPRVAFGGVRVTVEAGFDYTEARREESARDDPLVVDLRLGGPRD